MNWNRKRSYVCNHDLIRFFREEIGWSQQQLSIESDVSVRVISKAEAGESIAKASISRLTEALSINGQAVFPEDLVCFPMEMCRTFIDQLHEHKHRAIERLGEIIAPDATFKITGDPGKVPFAGNHKGARAYQRALKKFFQIFEFAPGFDHKTAYEFFPKGTSVVLWGVSKVRLIDGDGAIIKLPNRQLFRFRQGKLYSFEAHYDVLQQERFISKAVEIQGSKVHGLLENFSLG